MKNFDFNEEVVESLQMLCRALEKKAERLRLSDYAITMPYIAFLKHVAKDPQKYCAPGEEFNKNAQKLSFFVASDFPLCKIDERAAQNVYDIMVCMRDYMYFSDEKLRAPGKSIDECKYKSRQDAVDAMRGLKRDSIQNSTGVFPYFARKFINNVFSRTK